MIARRLLDTCILIDFLRGKEQARTFLLGLNQIPYLSALTVAELYGGVREGGERTKLDRLLTLFHVVPVSADIAKKGGLYRRQYHKSHGVGLVDALIAATAEEVSAIVVTLNKKHFPMISRLIVPYKG
jgi:predicted nucleic acid-binding protein